MRPGTLRLTIGNRIDKSEVARLSVDELMDKSRKAMISQLQPPMTDAEVYAVRQSRLPWLVVNVKLRPLRIARSSARKGSPGSAPLSVTSSSASAADR